MPLQASQERLLNCIDESTGKLLVTTRIRKLLPAAAEVPLSLLTEAESIKLLLETGGVSSDEPSEAAAAKIAKILGAYCVFVRHTSLTTNRFQATCLCIYQ